MEKDDMMQNQQMRTAGGTMRRPVFGRRGLSEPTQPSEAATEFTDRYGFLIAARAEIQYDKDENEKTRSYEPDPNAEPWQLRHRFSRR